MDKESIRIVIFSYDPSYRLFKFIVDKYSSEINTPIIPEILKLVKTYILLHPKEEYFLNTYVLLKIHEAIVRNLILIINLK